MDLMQDPKTETSQDNVNQLFRSERISTLLNRMSAREREILELRFGLKSGEALTLHDVAKQFKITRERVRQIEEVALKKLRSVVGSQSRDI